MKPRLVVALACLVSLASCSTTRADPQVESAPTIVNRGNPLFRDLYTADPAPLVVGDTLYLYVGHDEARGDQMFNITEWLAYSTKDMQHWTAHGPIMKPTDFSWVQKDAWASQVHEKDGKFWFYTAVEHDPAGSHGKSIGVAVADNPLGPFRDAKGSALVRNEDTEGPHWWDDIDPTVWTEEDGTSYLIWGNQICKIAKLKPNMIEFDGPIRTIDLPDFEEGPWVFKRGDIYYLAYASMDKAISPDERISYATAPSIEGPWTWRGELMGSATNSFTTHPGIAEFKGEWYLFYHVGTLNVGDQIGAIGRRAVAVEKMHFNPDGTIRHVEQTAGGVSILPQG
jgi:beta-xylosidase